jgi:hypothetical protein
MIAISVIVQTLLQAMDEACNDINQALQYQYKVWTHLLIQGFFFIFTIFYIE